MLQVDVLYDIILNENVFQPMFLSQVAKLLREKFENTLGISGKTQSLKNVATLINHRLSGF